MIHQPYKDSYPVATYIVRPPLNILQLQMIMVASYYIPTATYQLAATTYYYNVAAT